MKLPSRAPIYGCDIENSLLYNIKILKQSMETTKKEINLRSQRNLKQLENIMHCRSNNSLKENYINISEELYEMKPTSYFFASLDNTNPSN